VTGPLECAYLNFWAIICERYCVFGGLEKLLRRYQNVQTLIRIFM